MSFNSTLVRFKDAQASLLDLVFVGFNSTLVRFKAKSGVPITGIVDCFNSTLVRFKGRLPTRLGVYKTRFQFHIGSIQRTKAARVIIVSCRCFNSTLVRFKVLQICARVGAKFSFQFHIGSIQRASIDDSADRDYIVSIPHWFDSGISILMSHDQVSIPHWFDSKMSTWTWRGSAWSFQFHIGSIQSFKIVGHTLTIRLRFQFHIGSIQRFYDAHRFTTFL